MFYGNPVLAVFVGDSPEVVQCSRHGINMFDKSGPAHILLVDDEEIVTRFFQITLLRLGYRVSCFQDTAEALASLNSKDERYDLIFCDYVMPRQNGIQFATAVRQSDPDIPIILVTGFDREQIDRNRLQELGIQGCLFKPVKKTELAGAIRQALTGRTAPGVK